ncbi:MAG: rhodanese-like domain-containing protein [Bacteroidetes bacterium]|nr:MAG: rhodanese-like domain-containing protein [Bacteroidota bacterium]
MDITVSELKRRIDEDDVPVMIDVREPHEWEMQHLPQARKISLAEIPRYLDELQAVKHREIVLICRSGGRSGRATQFLYQQGFKHVRNLTGGMLAWKKEIDPSFNVE